ncbi:MAG: T9SS C-terminal target domain-containing protein [Calditrichaeota bacterium]|nr:MAG: T9SS C-terminal target domain-containing protein [Calditrichota bacterium]
MKISIKKLLKPMIIGIGAVTMFASSADAQVNWKLQEEFCDSTAFTTGGWAIADGDGSGTSFGLVANALTGAVLPQTCGNFVHGNFNSANGFLIDEWLISPQVTGIATGDSLVFWATAVDGGWNDSLKVHISTTGTNPADFTEVDYFKVDGPTGNWHRYSWSLDAFDGNDIHVAINWYHTDGGANGSASDNVSIDNVQVRNGVPAGASIAPDDIDFGSIAVGDSTSMQVTITNFDGAQLDITGVNYSSGVFSGTVPTDVPANSSSTFDIWFKPPIISTFNGTLTLQNSSGTDLVVNLAGEGFDNSANPLPFSENFDSATLPLGWSVVDGDGSGTSYTVVQQLNFTGATANPHSGMSFIHGSFNTANGNGLIDEWLISPAIDLSGGTNYNLNYWVSSVGGQFADSLKIWVSTTGTNPADFTEVDYFLVPGPVDTWSERNLDLTAFGGNTVHVAFNYFIVDGGPNGTHSDNVIIDDITIDLVTDIDDGSNAVPFKYALKQNYPNPFNPTTAIEFTLEKTESVTLSIFNERGQLVKTLVNDEVQAGNSRVYWNGTDANGIQVSSGVYFYSLETASGFRQTNKATFLK